MLVAAVKINDRRHGAIAVDEVHELVVKACEAVDRYWASESNQQHSIRTIDRQANHGAPGDTTSSIREAMKL